MSKNATKVINVGINAGWFGGSSANQLNKKISKHTDGLGEKWGIVQIIPNTRNLFMLGIFGVVAVLTLGFVAPSAGYAVVLEKIQG